MHQKMLVKQGFFLNVITDFQTVCSVEGSHLFISAYTFGESIYYNVENKSNNYVHFIEWIQFHSQPHALVVLC